MAKIDVTNIEGYADMTAEQKLAALEGYEMPEPDYSGYVRKDLYDKTASDLSQKKKELAERMTEDERKAQAEQEKYQEMLAKYNDLLKSQQILSTKNSYLSLGYDEELAQSTAQALIEGDMDTVFANQRLHQDGIESRIRASILSETPRPRGGNEGAPTMTKADLRKMSEKERFKFAQEHPDEYKEIYGG